MIYPDGTTNQPSPQPVTPSEEAPSQDLFDLAIKQIAVRQGTLMLDQDRIPFDLDGKDISAGMNYVPSQKAYDGHLDFTPLMIAYRNAAPMQAEMHVGFLLRSGETEIKSLRLAVGGSKIEASGDSPQLQQSGTHVAISGFIGPCAGGQHGKMETASGRAS